MRGSVSAYKTKTPRSSKHSSFNHPPGLSSSRAVHAIIFQIQPLAGTVPSWTQARPMPACPSYNLLSIDTAPINRGLLLALFCSYIYRLLATAADSHASSLLLLLSMSRPLRNGRITGASFHIQATLTSDSSVSTFPGHKYHRTCHIREKRAGIRSVFADCLENDVQIHIRVVCTLPTCKNSVRIAWKTAKI